MKRICFAIALLPFAACVVNPDDDDADTGADTENVSNTSPSTSSPSTSTTDDTQTGTGTTDPMTTGETDDPTTGGPGGLGFCVTNCETFEDCCEAAGVPMEMCMGDGLGGYACDENRCFGLGCADNMECEDLLGPTYGCSDSGTCIVPCETLDDCEMAAPGVYDTCDPDFGCTVEVEPFDCNEMGCTAPYVCDTDSGFCVECLEDADCEGGDYGPYCDTEINACACMSTEDCTFEIDVCEL
jgi:hypothetical protein